MLKIVRFNEVLKETRSTVTFMTNGGSIVNISKQRLYKLQDDFFLINNKSEFTPINLNEYYIAEGKEHGIILVITDLIQLKSVIAALNLNVITEY